MCLCSTNCALLLSFNNFFLSCFSLAGVTWISYDILIAIYVCVCVLLLIRYFYIFLGISFLLFSLRIYIYIYRESFWVLFLSLEHDTDIIEKPRYSTKKPMNHIIIYKIEGKEQSFIEQEMTWMTEVSSFLIRLSFGYCGCFILSLRHNCCCCLDTGWCNHDATCWLTGVPS